MVLTIDRNIQAEAERILKNLVQAYTAAGGSIIVQEPQTGRIIALVNYPSFNPNNYSQYDIKNFTNPAVQAIFEPGSVFKVITLAAGLDSGAITPETTYYDTGVLTFPDGKKIKNWDFKAHGTVGISGILEKSLNTGSAFVESRLGHKNFYNYLVKFGFGGVTGIDLPGEISGSLNNIKKYDAPIHFATASFGQGISVTPIQLISAISAIANKGLWLTPQITENTPAPEVRRVISEKAAVQIAQMKEQAVNKAGMARIAQYRVAGKTGTAQLPDFKSGGYTNDVINSYAGFAPVSRPQFSALIKLDKPEGAPLAGATVVPAFRELAQFILNYYNIPPDDLHP